MDPDDQDETPAPGPAQGPGPGPDRATAEAVRRLEEQVRALRLAFLRAACVVAVVLVVVGVVLPAWTTRNSALEGQETTVYRVATAGFQAFGQRDGAVVGIGFLGLLVVLVLQVGVLTGSVMSTGGRSGNRWARRTINTLAIVGTLVPLLLSALGASARGEDSGGWGPLVLAVGVVLATVIQAQRSWQDLWLDQEPPSGPRRF